MSDDDKAKPAKSVMGNLPSTRPARMGRRRDAGTATPEKAEAPRRSSPKAAAKPRAAAKPKATKAKAKAAAAKPTRATPKAAGRPAAQKPRAVRSGSPSLDAAKKASPGREPAPSVAPPQGTELVTTAVQATGELAKIGLTLGGQALKRAARRLPKP